MLHKGRLRKEAILFSDSYTKYFSFILALVVLFGGAAFFYDADGWTVKAGALIICIGVWSVFRSQTVLAHDKRELESHIKLNRELVAQEYSSLDLEDPLKKNMILALHDCKQELAKINHTSNRDSEFLKLQSNIILLGTIVNGFGDLAEPYVRELIHLLIKTFHLLTTYWS